MLRRNELILVALLLLLGLCIRVYYAWDQPLSYDEKCHLEFAGEISLNPGSLNLPLGNRQTNHLAAVLYLASLGLWIGQDYIIVVRVLFILFHMVGLVGLYFFSKRFFGPKAGLCALFLAITDIYLITSASMPLESATYILTVPWILYFFYDALETNRTRSWLAVGLLFGLAFQAYELVLLLFLPFFLYVVYCRKLGSVCKSSGFYTAAALFLLCTLPYVVWNMTNQYANVWRHMARASGIGVSPRVLAFYLGDIFVCFQDSAWVYLNYGGITSLPNNVPCAPVAGLLYLGSVLYSIRFAKDKKVVFLLLCFFCPAVVVSLFRPVEAWNA